MNESNDSSDNSHDHTEDQVEESEGVVPALVLTIAELNITNVHNGGNNAHQRRSTNSSGDSNDSRQVVEENSDCHAREDQKHGNNHLNSIRYE